jgi:hypothetical protein
MILHQVLVFDPISILDLLSHLNEKPAFTIVFAILIAKLNSPSQMTSKS